MARPGVTLISSFTYRGAPEEYANQYHFAGDAPADDAGWRDLMTSLIGLAVAMIPSPVHIVRAYGYDDTDHDSVFTWDLAGLGGPQEGTCPIGAGAVAVPGDGAYWARWETGRDSSRGKPVYLRKYFHPAFVQPTSPDVLDETMHDAAFLAAGALYGVTDDWPGIAGPSYELGGGLNALVSHFVTTRTLKRRGRRP